MKKLGYKRSLSKWAKDSVKSAVKFITAFESQLIFQSKERGCVGVICGHVHKPEDKMINGIRYLNCGDWIENNSCIVYEGGEFKIIFYDQKDKKRDEELTHRRRRWSAEEPGCPGARSDR